MSTARKRRPQQAPRRSSARSSGVRSQARGQARGQARRRPQHAKPARSQTARGRTLAASSLLTSLRRRWAERRERRAVARAEAARAASEAVVTTDGEPPRRDWPRRLARLSLRLGATMAVAWALLVGGREVYEYATTSARFEAKHFIFEPSEHVDDETLRELLAIETGTNILALDLNALSERVAAHPWVAEAVVTRNLPDTLEVQVTEHVAEAIVLAGRFYLVDGEGRPFKQVERGERGELPIITGVDRALLLDDGQREQAAAEIRRGLEVLHLYQGKQRPRLGELHLGEDGAVTLYTAQSGTALQLGRDDFAARLERWDALRVALGDRADRLAVVHLDHESKPDRRDRVVARFASERDEAVLLAQAGFEQPGEDEGEGGAAEAVAPSKPRARAAGRRNRIPRYE